MNDPHVSVIIPIFNTEQYLDACLDSLIKQRFTSYEIICIDDCSTDNSLSIVLKYQQEHPDLFTVLKNDENIGQGSSRERGILCARGTYLMFIDSDDYVQPDYIDTYYRYASARELDIVVGGYKQDIDGKLFRESAPEYPWSLTTYSILCTKMFRTSFLRDNQIRFSHQRRGEDIFFNLNCYCHDARCETIDYSGYCCRLNRSSTTRTISGATNFECNIAAMFSELLDHVAHVPLSEQKQQMLCYSYLVNMINALITYGHGCGPKRMREKYNFFRDNAQILFPQYQNNPLATKLHKQHGQTTKIRYAVWLLMNMHRLRLDYPLYAIASML